MKVNFNFTKEGLSVIFRDLSTEVPANSTYSWDFGDLISSQEINPTHIYEREGFYSVTLTITPPTDSNEETEDPTPGPISITYNLGVSDKIQTVLSDSVYGLVDMYVPEILRDYLTPQMKQALIEKWQLYLQPIVNRPLDQQIPIEEYNNQFYYEALENQLIAQLVAYDFFIITVQNMLQSATQIIEDSSSSTEGSEGEEAEGNQRIKAIKTGPTEVEYFEGLSGSAAANLAKTITGAFQPGGIVEELKNAICMLAERLRIFLPICPRVKRVTVPIVGNRRIPGLLSGPNPRFPIKRGVGDRMKTPRRGHKPPSRG